MKQGVKGPYLLDFLDFRVFFTGSNDGVGLDLFVVFKESSNLPKQMTYSNHADMTSKLFTPHKWLITPILAWK